MSRSRLNHFLMSVLAVTIVMVVWNESPSSYCHASPRWEHNFFLNCPHFWKYFPVWALLSNNTFLSCKISSLLLVFASLLCVWERALSLFSRPPTRQWSPPTHTHSREDSPIVFFPSSSPFNSFQSCARSTNGLSDSALFPPVHHNMAFRKKLVLFASSFIE